MTDAAREVLHEYFTFIVEQLQDIRKCNKQKRLTEKTAARIAIKYLVTDVGVLWSRTNSLTGGTPIPMSLISETLEKSNHFETYSALRKRLSKLIV